MTLQRVLTAVILIPVVVVAIWWGPSLLVAGLAGLVLLLAMNEFFGLAQMRGLGGYRLWTCACALGLVLVQWSEGREETWRLGFGVSLVRNATNVLVSVEALLIIFALGVALLGVLGRRAVAEVLAAAGTSSAAMLLIALPFSYLARLTQFNSIGRQLVLFACALVWAGDSLAWLVGRSIGRIKLAPVLSPKKTWEGTIANLAASMLVGYLFSRWVSADIGPAILAAAAANVAGQFGDLLESAYKRGAGVKDSSALLPGHGGMLDRIDSLIFAVPVVWYYASLFLAHRG